jgi:hypothetical protein
MSGMLDRVGPVAFSSDDWCTPEWLADALGGFDMDPCSNERSHIRSADACSLATGSCGLERDWGCGSVFCNPPYSDVGPWAAKLAAHAGPWCALVKLDPTTKWWATLMTSMPTVAPFRKRIRFEGQGGGAGFVAPVGRKREGSRVNNQMTANFPSVLVYSAWRPPAALVRHLWLPTYAEAA